MPCAILDTALIQDFEYGFEEVLMPEIWFSLESEVRKMVVKAYQPFQLEKFRYHPPSIP